jgi:hypothetical protein
MAPVSAPAKHYYSKYRVIKLKFIQFFATECSLKSLIENIAKK